MNELELMLSGAGADIEWPATPDMTSGVAERIQRAPQPARVRRTRVWRPLAIAFAALLLLTATAAAIPGIREPVLDFLGLRSVKIERVPGPLPAAPGASLGLGNRTTLAAARGRLAFTPLVPAGLGDPTVYYEGFPPGGQLGLVYDKGTLFITEVQGQLQTQYLFKFVGPDAKVDRVRINGERGVWIHGQPHQFAYADKTGEIRDDTVRTAGDVLLWRNGDLLLRLEGARSKADALRIARSVRESP
jgi:hypothetical protein